MSMWSNTVDGGIILVRVEDNGELTDRSGERATHPTVTPQAKLTGPEPRSHTHKRVSLLSGILIH